MTVRQIIQSTVFCFAIGCQSNGKTHDLSREIDNKPTSDSIPIVAADSNDDSTGQYTKIVKITEHSDTVFIDADYVQFLTGDAAIEAAKKMHAADTFKTPDGQTHIDVPDDYFIINQNKKIRHLRLSPNCTFELVENPDRPDQTTLSKLATFKKIYRETLFTLTFDRLGQVIKIREIFLP